MNITCKQATILHNAVRYPIIVIAFPFQAIALLLKWVADLLFEISKAWGLFIIIIFNIR